MGDLELTRLQLLEQRRKDNDQAMWLAPVVLIAAQGFLLKVLSDGGLGSIARLVVLLAGLAATTSACWMLFVADRESGSTAKRSRPNSSCSE